MEELLTTNNLPAPPVPGIFVNRELSWLEFNRRVLSESLNPKIPLMERLKFLSIYFSNLDEFFMVRVGSLHDQSIVEPNKLDDKTGLNAAGQIDAILKKVAEINPIAERAWESIKQQMRAQDIDLMDTQHLNKLDEQIVQKYFAEKIAGDRFNINCIVPPGSNPEAYDPSPSHLVHLGKSIAYFKIGHIGFELAWMDKLEQNNPNMKIFDTSEGIDILSGTHEHNDADVHHHHFDADPHTWSSPKNVRIIARNMYEAFVSIDPDGEKVFRKNYKELLDEINQVDSIMTERLSPVSGTMFAIYHPSLSYLAKDYNLHQLSLEYNGKEPSAFYLKKAIDIARENNVKVIFIQQEFDAKQAESFASEINAKVVPINPLSYNWSEELLHITDAIAGK